MPVSPEALAAHADNLRLNPLISQLEDLIEQAGDRIRIDTADGRIAGFLFERLHSVRADLQPVIERLARREAEAEAQTEAEMADYDLAWADAYPAA